MAYYVNHAAERNERNRRKQAKKDAKLREMEEIALQRKLAKQAAGDQEMRPAHKCIMRDGR
jgi:hypothetical protein